MVDVHYLAITLVFDFNYSNNIILFSLLNYWPNYYKILYYFNLPNKMRDYIQRCVIYLTKHRQYFVNDRINIIRVYTTIIVETFFLSIKQYIGRTILNSHKENTMVFFGNSKNNNIISDLKHFPTVNKK